MAHNLGGMMTTKFKKTPKMPLAAKPKFQGGARPTAATPAPAGATNRPAALPLEAAAAALEVADEPAPEVIEAPLLPDMLMSAGIVVAPAISPEVVPEDMEKVMGTVLDAEPEEEPEEEDEDWAETRALRPAMRMIEARMLMVVLEKLVRFVESLTRGLLGLKENGLSGIVS
ncbi:MAG: hypothetical protein M1821_008142 [Bathelium mastoideum]|nr:MAG: hypothetical protein M1821_008142 [Bathelium mastoideum]